MSPNNQPPALLPWYVSGKLDPTEAAEVEGHILHCPECRDEVEALESLRRTVLAYGNDLDLLERIDDPGTEPTGAAPGMTRSRAKSWSWGLAGAAAATLLLVVALPALRGHGPDSAGKPLLTEAPPIVLMPVQRGSGETDVLRGSGPWSIQLVLPLSWPDVECRVWIDREDGGVVPGSEATVRPVSGRLALILRTLDGAGRYRIMIEAGQGGADSARTTAYPFEVAP